MTKRFLFVGAGAIGSYLGAFLSRAGHDVTLIDPWAEQVEAIRAHGIRVAGPHAPFEARPAAVHLHEAARLPRDFKIAVVAVKAYDTAWAAAVALRHLAPGGYVVSAQNCWPDPIVAQAAGAGRAVGLVMSKIGVATWSPGQVERGVEQGRGAGHDVFRVGEHDERVSPRTQELAVMLAVIDGARATDNLWGERWAKLSQNAMSNPLQAMSGLGSLEVASSEGGRTLMIRLAAECASVGLALGHRVPAFAGAPAEQWADAGAPRDARRSRPAADADGGGRPELARLDGAGRRQGPPDGDRRDERLRGRRGAGLRDGDARVASRRGDRARGGVGLAPARARQPRADAAPGGPLMGRGFALYAGVAPKVIRAAAREAEAAGYTSFWVNYPGVVDGLAVLALAAAETTRIALGVGVVPLHTHGPDRIVADVRANALPLDRLLLGVGSPNPASLARVRTGIAALRAALPARLYVAALGPRMCHLAGEVADGVLFNWLTPEHARASAEWVRAGARAAGRPAPRLSAYVRVAVGAAGPAQLEVEGRRYAAIPAYAAHFARMAVPPVATAVAAATAAEVPEALARWEDAVDEVVVRAITPYDTIDETLALLQAARPG